MAQTWAMVKNNAHLCYSRGHTYGCKVQQCKFTRKMLYLKNIKFEMNLASQAHGDRGSTKYSKADVHNVLTKGNLGNLTFSKPQLKHTYVLTKQMFFTVMLTNHY